MVMLLLHICALCDIIAMHLFESYPKTDKIHHHKRPDLRDRLFYFAYDSHTLRVCEKLAWEPWRFLLQFCFP